MGASTSGRPNDLADISFRVDRFGQHKRVFSVPIHDGLVPVCSSSTKNGKGFLLQLKFAADFVRAVEWTASRPSYG